MNIEDLPKSWDEKARAEAFEILNAMERSTTPQTGYTIFNKIRSKISTNSDRVCLTMVYLKECSYLKHIGYDNDYDSIYELNV